MNIGTSKAYPFHNDGGDEDDDSVHAQMDTILTTLVMPFIISKEVKAFAKCVSLNPGGTREQCRGDARGIFGVEMFLLEDGSVLLNELLERCFRRFAHVGHEAK